MKKTKIGIIGIGNVGAHVLYTLALQGLAQEFVLIDIDEKKAGADLQDVFDCAMYLPHPVHMSVGTFSDLKDCDIIVYSVGKIDLLRQGHNRLTELNFNIPAAIENARKIKESGFSGILINISNPCDIVTRELANRLELPKGHVFGTGTGLDTARLGLICWENTETISLPHGPVSAFMADRWRIGLRQMPVFASTCRRRSMQR